MAGQGRERGVVWRRHFCQKKMARAVVAEMPAYSGAARYQRLQGPACRCQKLWSVGAEMGRALLKNVSRKPWAVLEGMETGGPGTSFSTSRCEPPWSALMAWRRSAPPAAILAARRSLRRRAFSWAGDSEVAGASAMRRSAARREEVWWGWVGLDSEACDGQLSLQKQMPGC